MFMAIMLYLPLMEGPGRELYGVVKAAASKRKIELYRTMPEFSERLHHPVCEIKVTVLLAADKSDLLKLTALGDFLKNMRIILILPDHEAETIAQGHLLRPRFMAWLDDNFAHVGTVLKKMLSLYDESVHRPPKHAVLKTLGNATKQAGF